MSISVNNLRNILKDTRGVRANHRERELESALECAIDKIEELENALKVNDENTLREEIKKTWGEFGWHIQVFDMLLNRYKELKFRMEGLEK